MITFFQSPSTFVSLTHTLNSSHYPFSRDIIHSFGFLFRKQPFVFSFSSHSLITFLAIVILLWYISCSIFRSCLFLAPITFTYASFSAVFASLVLSHHYASLLTVPHTPMLHSSKITATTCFQYRWFSIHSSSLVYGRQVAVVLSYNKVSLFCLVAFLHLFYLTLDNFIQTHLLQDVL